MSIYDAVGGTPTFERLVDSFYEGVQTDPVLRPMYPEELTESRRRLALFLIQYFGGPTTYSDERGHPRLRQRHLGFSIGSAARDAWLFQMTRALAMLQLPTTEHDEMLRYFTDAATFLINRPG